MYIYTNVAVASSFLEFTSCVRIFKLLLTQATCYYYGNILNSNYYATAGGDDCDIEAAVKQL